LFTPLAWKYSCFKYLKKTPHTHQYVVKRETAKICKNIVCVQSRGYVIEESKTFRDRNRYFCFSWPANTRSCECALHNSSRLPYKSITTRNKCSHRCIAVGTRTALCPTGEWCWWRSAFWTAVRAVGVRSERTTRWPCHWLGRNAGRIAVGHSRPGTMRSTVLYMYIYIRVKKNYNIITTKPCLRVVAEEERTRRDLNMYCSSLHLFRNAFRLNNVVS